MRRRLFTFTEKNPLLGTRPEVTLSARLVKKKKMEKERREDLFFLYLFFGGGGSCGSFEGRGVPCNWESVQPDGDSNKYVQISPLTDEPGNRRGTMTFLAKPFVTIKVH